MANAKSATIEQAQARIRDANIIAIVLSDHASLDCIGSAYAFAEAMKGIGKTVSLFAPRELPLKNMVPWGNGDHDNEPLREFIISFDLSRSPIKELRYEKAENRLDIILSPTSSRIRREDVEFRYGPTRYDLVVTIGLARAEEAASSLALVPELLHEKPILNIDANADNQGYGELNLFPTHGEQSSIPMIIYQLLESLQTLPSEASSASALYASLMQATDNFQARNITGAELRAAATLRDRGADPEIIERALRAYRTNDTPNTRLLGRALARSRIDEQTGAAVLMLTPDDFEKTNASKNDVAPVFEHASRLFPEARHLILLWQDVAASPIETLVLMEEPRNNEKIRISLIPHPTFPEAERGYAELLARADAVE